MKKHIHSTLTALLLTSTLSMAGGDITPVEPTVTTPETTTNSFTTNGLYAGLGYTYMTMDNTDLQGDVTGNGFTLIGGYNFNEYIGLEIRYSQTLDDLSADIGSDAGDLSNFALYLKPQYHISDRVTLYGLLGYGHIIYNDGYTDYSEDSFQYGAGAGITLTDNIGLYVDYTILYDDDGFDTLKNNDISTDTLNVGVYYNF